MAAPSCIFFPYFPSTKWSVREGCRFRPMDMSPGREKDRGVVELDLLRASGSRVGEQKEVVLVRRTLIILAVALFTVALSGPASAQPKGPGSFTFHLECENGAEFDILVPVGQSFAALVQGSNSVAVLKGVDLNFDGTPEILVPGFSLDDLTACTVFEAGEPIFLSFALLTPRQG